MSLFKQKCEYCREKIEKGKEISKDVKVPVGTRKKPFCCSEHANRYEEEIGKRKSENSGGGCC